MKIETFIYLFLKIFRPCCWGLSRCVRVRSRVRGCGSYLGPPTDYFGPLCRRQQRRCIRKGTLKYRCIGAHIHTYITYVHRSERFYGLIPTFCMRLYTKLLISISTQTAGADLYSTTNNTYRRHDEHVYQNILEYLAICYTWKAGTIQIMRNMYNY